jgi:cyclopropane-fatty-acyl-phospholipid synthase
MGFDERFRRMWRYYLAYCGAGFASGRTDVRQIVLEPA